MLSHLLGMKLYPKKPVPTIIHHISSTEPPYIHHISTIYLSTVSPARIEEYRTDLPVWNLAPLFPGDGSTVFMDFGGGVYRLDLTTGRVRLRIQGHPHVTHVNHSMRCICYVCTVIK